MPTNKKSSSASRSSKNTARGSSKIKAKKNPPKKQVAKKPAPSAKHKPVQKAKKAPVKQQQPPKTPYIKTPPPSDEDLENLFLKARTRSFLTENEILYAFPDIEDYIPVYEAFIDRLDASGIAVLEIE